MRANFKDKAEQIADWSRLYGRPISEEEFRQIQYNLKGFFTTLKEWADEEKQAEKNRIKNRKVS